MILRPCARTFVLRFLRRRNSHQALAQRDRRHTLPISPSFPGRFWVGPVQCGCAATGSITRLADEALPIMDHNPLGTGLNQCSTLEFPKNVADHARAHVGIL